MRAAASLQRRAATRSSSGGFTLVEVIASLVIVTMAIGVMLETGGNAMTNAVFAVRSQTATWLGNEVLTRAVMGEFAENGLPEQDGQTTTMTLEVTEGDERFFDSEDIESDAPFPYRDYRITVERTLTSDPLGRNATSTTGTVAPTTPAEGEEEEEEPVVYVMRIAVIVHFPDPSGTGGGEISEDDDNRETTADGRTLSTVTLVTYEFPPNDIAEAAAETADSLNGTNNPN